MFKKLIPLCLFLMGCSMFSTIELHQENGAIIQISLSSRQETLAYTDQIFTIQCAQEVLMKGVIVEKEAYTRMKMAFEAKDRTENIYTDGKTTYWLDANDDIGLVLDSKMDQETTIDLLKKLRFETK